MLSELTPWTIPSSIHSSWLPTRMRWCDAVSLRCNAATHVRTSIGRIITRGRAWNNHHVRTSVGRNIRRGQALWETHARTKKYVYRILRIRALYPIRSLKSKIVGWVRVREKKYGFWSFIMYIFSLYLFTAGKRKSPSIFRNAWMTHPLSPSFTKNSNDNEGFSRGFKFIYDLLFYLP